MNSGQMRGELRGKIGCIIERKFRISLDIFNDYIRDGENTAGLIDEIPVLAVLGAASRDGLVVRDAGELRIKETDRIATVAENFRRMGVEVEVLPDGMSIPGGQHFRAATFDSFGDHRIAMAFSVAALRADGPCTIENSEAASVSFPECYPTLRMACQK